MAALDDHRVDHLGGEVARTAVIRVIDRPAGDGEQAQAEEHHRHAGGEDPGNPARAGPQGDDGAGEGWRRGAGCS